MESVVNPAVVAPAIDSAAAGGVSTPRIPLTRPSAHQLLCGPSSQASSTPSSGSPLTSLTSARPKPEKKLVALQTVVASPQVGYLCSFFRSTNFFSQTTGLSKPSGFGVGAQCSVEKHLGETASYLFAVPARAFLDICEEQLKVFDETLFDEALN